MSGVPRHVTHEPILEKGAVVMNSLYVFYAAVFAQAQSTENGVAEHQNNLQQVAVEHIHC